MSSICKRELATKDRPLLRPESIGSLKRRLSDVIIRDNSDCPSTISSGYDELDSLFPQQGLPFGQIFELTGGASCGKTSLLINMLARFSTSHTIGYVDLSGCLSPHGLVSSGLNRDNFILVRSNKEDEAIKAAEQFVRTGQVSIIVCDLCGRSEPLNSSQVHRLRINTVRFHRLVILLTDDSKQLLPPSMVSGQLKVERITPNKVNVTVTKSRIITAGRQAEIRLN